MSEVPHDALTEMVANMSERVSKMRGLPDLQKHRCYSMPGDHIRRVDGDEFVSLVTESENWSKIDVVILKALDAMKKAHEKDIIAKLQERVFDLAMEYGHEDKGLEYLAVRMIDTRRKVEEYGRLRRVAAGEGKALSTDALFYGDGTVEEMILAHAVVLGDRGILKKKKKQQQE